MGKKAKASKPADDVNLEDDELEDEDDEDEGETEDETETASDSSDDESESEDEGETPAAGGTVSLKGGHDVTGGADISGVKILGKKTDFVAVQHFHGYHRGLRERVYSKKQYGKKFETLAKSFSVANPRPNVNSFGMVLPPGVKPPKPEKNLVRYVSASEAAAIVQKNADEHAAINARRDAEYERGDKVNPLPRT